MRIVTWNVNGIRSLIKEYGSIDCVFDKLKADVVCIQVVLLVLSLFEESRIGTNDITADLIPEGYDAFASSCTTNSGYAGVMTFVRVQSRPSKSYSSLKEYVSPASFLH